MSDAGQLPPESLFFQTLFGFMATRTLSAVAELNVADALSEGPRYYTDLAEAVGADERSLHRAMRMLASTGVFAEPEPGTFALTPVSDLLRSDVPGSMRDMAVMITAESHWLPWGRFTDTLRSGRSGTQHAFGTDAFSWFQRAENKEQWELFNAAMTSFSSITGGAVAESYDFGGFTLAGDMGSSYGPSLPAPHRPKGCCLTCRGWCRVSPKRWMVESSARGETSLRVCHPGVTATP